MHSIKWGGQDLPAGRYYYHYYYHYYYLPGGRADGNDGTTRVKGWVEIVR